MTNYKMLNGVTLAYIGDSYYDLMIRRHLIDQGLTKVKDLHKNATKYVSAPSQAKVVDTLINENLLTSEELDIVKRGRNGKVNHKKSNVDILTYKHSTSFEALIGYLYLLKRFERMDVIVKASIEIIESW